MNKWLEDILAPLFRKQRRALQTEALVVKRQEARLQLDEAIEKLAQARARKATKSGT